MLNLTSVIKFLNYCFKVHYFPLETGILHRTGGVSAQYQVNFTFSDHLLLLIYITFTGIITFKFISYEHVLMQHLHLYVY